jgi:hypothetical protein
MNLPCCKRVYGSVLLIKVMALRRTILRDSPIGFTALIPTVVAKLVAQVWGLRL